MDNHPDATQLFQALTIEESLNVSPEAENGGVEDSISEVTYFQFIRYTFLIHFILGHSNLNYLP
jgi:hypothetical protein